MARKLSRTTTDHDEIRGWAEARGGSPAEVAATRRGKDDTGIIRIDFPGYSGEGKLRPISWDDWFEKFDRSDLALVIQDETSGGQLSNFNKLVAREGSPRRSRGATGARSRSRARATTARGTARAAAKGRGAKRSTGGRTGGRAGSRTTTGRRAAAGRSVARSVSSRARPAGRKGSGRKGSGRTGSGRTASARRGGRRAGKR